MNTNHLLLLITKHKMQLRLNEKKSLMQIITKSLGAGAHSSAMFGRDPLRTLSG